MEPKDRLTANKPNDGPKNNVQPPPPAQTSDTAKLTEDRSSDETLECGTQDIGTVKNPNPRTDLLPLVESRSDVERARPARSRYDPKEESLENQTLKIVNGYQR